jgi:hypothetical protein
MHDFFHACQLRKHARLPFPSSASRTTKPFDLGHCDLRTSPVVSVLGFKYYLVILDNFSHYLWISLLRLKSDTYTTLPLFFAYVFTQFGCSIRSVQCDNEKDFDKTSTRSFLLSHGALHVHVMPIHFPTKW